MNLNDLYGVIPRKHPRPQPPTIEEEEEGDFKRQHLEPSNNSSAPINRNSFQNAQAATVLPSSDHENFKNRNSSRVDATTKKVNAQAAMVLPSSDHENFNSPHRTTRSSLLPIADAPTPRLPRARSRLQNLRLLGDTDRENYTPPDLLSAPDSFDNRRSYPTFLHQIQSIPSPLFLDAGSDSMYKAPSGRMYPLICERTTKGCGPTCATMLFLGLIPKGKESHLATYTTRDYWEWHNVPFRNVENIASKMNGYTQINVLGYVPETVRQQFENAAKVLETVREKLTDSGQPVILAIQHETLGGHFITVDEYDKGFYYVRDPFSGHPYKVSQKELESVIEADITDVFKISFLYLEPIVNNLLATSMDDQKSD